MKIKAVNLSYSVGDLKVLEDINFVLQSGQMMLIKGSSGKGKTTLCNIIALNIRATRGDLYFDDKDLNSLDKIRFLRKIGFIPQDFMLIDTLTTQMNIALPLFISCKSIDYEKIDVLMRLFEIWDLRNKETEFLSGGEKRRLMICRAMAMSPALIIADEPLAGLDKTISQKVISTFLHCQKSGASLIVTGHDLSDDWPEFDLVLDLD